MTGWGKWSNNGGEPNRRGGFALPGTEMNLLWSQANVTDGVAQEARLPYALEPGFFLPQERKIHDHLALASRMVELVRLPSGSGGPSMHWGALFKSEPAVAMAEMLSFQIEEKRAAFEVELDRDPEQAVNMLYRRANHVRGLHDKLLAHGYETLSEMIQGVGDQMRTPVLLEKLALFGASGAGELAVKLAEASGEPLTGDAVQRARSARRVLVHAHEHFLTIYRTLRPRLERAFDERLKSGLIDPAIGLLISQFHVLGAAEKRMNRFVDRHTEFYYRKVLGQAPRKATEDTILLRFLPSAAQTVVEDGARVLGRVSGQDRLHQYDLMEPLRVIPAAVTDARTLIFDRDPAISNQSSLGYVTGIRGYRRDLGGSESSERIFAPSGEGSVDLGINLSSNILRLAEGRREITVQIGMQLRRPIELPQMTRHEQDRLEGPSGVYRRRMPAGSYNKETKPSQEYEARLREAVFVGLRADKATAEAFAANRQSDAVENVFKALLARILAGDRSSQRDQFFKACLDAAENGQQLRAIFGRIVAETLVEGRAWPTGEFRRLLLAKLKAIALDGSSTQADQPLLLTEGPREGTSETSHFSDVVSWLQRDPEEVFQEFLNGAFSATLSTAEGAFPVASARTVPNERTSSLGRYVTPGFQLRIVLDEAVPAIVPPEGADAPVLRLRMSDGSIFCPFSLFEAYAIDQITTTVTVSGLKQLAGFSDDGPLDLSQPFTPFGAIPRHKARFLIGAPELAMKPVTSVSLDLEWAGLPSGAAGFFEHYKAYGDDFVVPNPKLHPSYLTVEGWKALDDNAIPMIAQRQGQVGLISKRQLSYRIPGRPSTARSGTSTIDFQQRSRVRAGLMRLELDCPDGVFGHSAYPSALSRAMRPTLVPFRRRPVPEPPYVPQISGVSMSYSAREVIDIDAPQAARPDQRLVQISPFGQQEIYPVRKSPGAGLFVDRIANGNLFLKFEGSGLEDTISILFEMEKSSHKRVSFAPPQVEWQYLTDSGWKKLPKWAVQSDSTDGLMRSGVLRVTMPEDAVSESEMMPGNGIWLALCVNAHLADFPRLQSVTLNGARALRVREKDEPKDEAVPDSWFLDVARPGIAGIEHVGATVQGIAAEETRAFRVRVAERLRHRKRGVMPWDVERLVLDAFPQVWKAKCFPALDKQTNLPVPGAVSLIVVPHAPENASENPSQPRMFDVLTLRKIREEIAPLMSSFSDLEVSNPSYEHLQVRARIGFKTGRDDGSLIQRLKLEVSRYLSLWTAPAPMNGFGWSVHLNDVGAFIANLDYVDFFSELSVLQLVADDKDKYRLLDTARDNPNAPGSARDLTYRTPWALPLSMHEHWIVPTREKIIDQAVPTGIGGLVVGQTLVIDRSN